MQLETKRLILRYLKEDDLESVFNNYANDDEVTKFLSWPTHKDLNDTKMIFDIWDKEDDELKKYHYFLVLKETNELIGSCCVHCFIDGNPEIGIVLGRKWWRQGLMTEAVLELIKQLFSDGYEKIIMKAVDQNIASNKLIQKCGFKYVGIEKFYAPLKNQKFLLFDYELEK